jgi:hypothetical protein
MIVFWLDVQVPAVVAIPMVYVVPTLLFMWAGRSWEPWTRSGGYQSVVALGRTRGAARQMTSSTREAASDLGEYDGFENDQKRAPTSVLTSVLSNQRASQ